VGFSREKKSPTCKKNSPGRIPDEPPTKPATKPTHPEIPQKPQA